MIRKQLSIFCSILLFWAGAAAQAQVPQPRPKPTIQEQLTEMPAGAVVEVTLLNKHKLKGRLGEISAGGFVLQHAVKDRIEMKNIGFDEVKSIKQIRKEGMSRGGLIGLSMLAGLGLLVLITWIACAAGGCYD
jgi:hypothetical protein